MSDRILLSGGAGYIGSHCAVLLLEAGYQVIIADDFSNSQREVLRRIKNISGKDFTFYEEDLCNRDATRAIFLREKPDAVLHFAGYKAVGESVKKPLMYYRNNLDNALSVLEAMQASSCRRLIFSSSATVYEHLENSPLIESEGLGCKNPYGWTKFMIEQMIRDLCRADESLSCVLLRYFNPVGAHPSGQLGEDPQGIPNNLVPYIAKVAIGKLPYLSVYGNDYDTPDGTGVRDYIHIMDLAEGHLAALKYSTQMKGAQAINLGTGKGYSVLDVLHAFERACGKKLPYQFVDRRPGDFDFYYADPSLAEKLLGWRAKYSLDDMCRDSWKWQSENPRGYAAEP